MGTPEPIIDRETAERILKLSAAGKSDSDISSELSLPVLLVFRVTTGKTWKDAAGQRRGKLYGEVTRSIAQRIIKLKGQASVPRIAQATRLGETTVRKILKGEWSPLWDRRDEQKRQAAAQRKQHG